MAQLLGRAGGECHRRDRCSVVRDFGATKRPTRDGSKTRCSCYARSWAFLAAWRRAAGRSVSGAAAQLAFTMTACETVRGLERCIRLEPSLRDQAVFPQLAPESVRPDAESFGSLPPVARVGLERAEDVQGSRDSCGSRSSVRLDEIISELVLVFA